MRWKTGLRVRSMFRLLSRHGRRVGLPPGTPTPEAGENRDPVVISAFDYTPGRLEEAAPASPGECARFRNDDTVTWIDVKGVHDVAVLKGFEEGFALHPLLVEDVANTSQLPKFEEYPDQVYVVAKMFVADPGGGARAEQLSIVIGTGWVLTFQETPQDVFESLRQRLRVENSRLRTRGADYLAYRLLDCVVDHYFVVLEGMGEGLEEAEEQLLARPTREALETAYNTRRDLIVLRRHVSPLREVIAAWRRRDEDLSSGELDPFLRDLHDHALQAQDLVVTYREMVAGMIDLYHTGLATRMNEVMKVLTIIATIFIPLSFVAGLYGMNFEGMPELGWRWGYPMALGIMGGVAGAMLLFFRRRGWL